MVESWSPAAPSTPWFSSLAALAALAGLLVLTLGLSRITPLPATRLIVFEALAVNAGSAMTPIGNPQNLFLWQLSRASFAEVTWHMAPLVAVLSILLVALTVGVFPGKRLRVEDRWSDAPLDRPLLLAALVMCVPFLLAAAAVGYWLLFGQGLAGP